MPALAPNSLIAITGISGYIASHTGLCILRGGHRIRGTVRSWARAESLKAGYEKQGIPVAELDKRLEFMIVDDLNSEEQWTTALKDVDGVVHTALNLDKLRDSEIIDEAILGTLSVLRAAKKYPSIKRVVLTSSIAAMITPPLMRDRVLTTEDWNDEAVAIVKKGPSASANLDPRLKRAYPAFFYSTAKVQAERAAWEFATQTSYDLVTILPATNMGPILHDGIPLTAQWAISGLKNDITYSRTTPTQWFVDVRDCAKLHFLALTTPSMGGKRFLAIGEAYGWNQIFDIYRKNFPNVSVPEDFEEGTDFYTQKVDVSASTELLGGWISLEESLVDLGKSLGYRACGE